jgi:prevent-host-death family protein
MRTTRAIGVRDAKAQLSQILREVALGRECIVTDRGKPIARIVPIERSRAPLHERVRRLERAGILESAPRHAHSIPHAVAIERGLARRMLDADRNG